jgi:hypothetical protein
VERAGVEAGEDVSFGDPEDVLGLCFFGAGDAGRQRVVVGRREAAALEVLDAVGGGQDHPRGDHGAGAGEAAFAFPGFDEGEKGELGDRGLRGRFGARRGGKREDR